MVQASGTSLAPPLRVERKAHSGQANEYRRRDDLRFGIIGLIDQGGSDAI